MTHRERILAVLKGGKPDIIPCWGECGMDVTVLKEIYPPKTGDRVADSIKVAELFNNSVCDIGLNLGIETISRDSNHHTYQYETGAIWHEIYNNTYCREAIYYPINKPEDTLTLKITEVSSPDRLEKATGII